VFFTSSGASVLHLVGTSDRHVSVVVYVPEMKIRESRIVASNVMFLMLTRFSMLDEHFKNTAK